MSWTRKWNGKRIKVSQSNKSWNQELHVLIFVNLVHGRQFSLATTWIRLIHQLNTHYQISLYPSPPTSLEHGLAISWRQNWRSIGCKSYFGGSAPALPTDARHGRQGLLANRQMHVDNTDQLSIAWIYRLQVPKTRDPSGQSTPPQPNLVLPTKTRVSPKRFARRADGFPTTKLLHSR